MTEEEIRKRRKERKKKARQRRKRKVMIRRAVALIVMCCIVALMVRGTMAVASFFSHKESKDEVSSQPTAKQVAKIEDPFENEADSIDIDELDVSDEMGQNLLEYVDEYPEVKILLKNRQDYPDELLQIFLNNQETLQFILDYPQKHEQQQEITLNELPEEGKIPLYIQWDEQWGYNSYGNNIIAISGCGPTSLSMVATGLLRDVTLNPYAVASFSQESGYCTSVGTDWSLMSEGANALGLDSENISLSEESVKNALESGKPIICSMGPGFFTTAGHFIVLTGYKDGYVTVNDPNSKANSEKKWEFAQIRDQIKNLWAFSVHNKG